MDDLADPDAQTAVCADCHQLGDAGRVDELVERAGTGRHERVAAWLGRRRSCYPLDLPEFYFYDAEGRVNPTSRDW